MARKINKQKIPFDTWSTEKWGLFYKEVILCENRVNYTGKMDEHAYGVILTSLYFRYPNYSHWSRETKIPRAAIAKAVNKTIDKFTHSDSNI